MSSTFSMGFCISREKTQLKEIRIENPLFDGAEQNDEISPNLNSPPVISDKIIDEKFDDIKNYIFIRLEMVCLNDETLLSEYEVKAFESFASIR